MDAQERREARLSRKREREQRNHALESVEEREAWLARWGVRDRAVRAAQSTAQREKATQKGAQIRRRVYACMYIHAHIRLFGRICAATSNIRKLAQARPTMPAFL